LKIVSIDDSKINNAVIEYAIDAIADEKGLKYSIKSFTNPIEGLEYLKNNKIDILFLDIMMPEMDGFELLAHLRKYDNDIYVCIVTALKDKDTKKEAKELGANGYISKPYDDDEIKLVIEEYLKNKEENQEGTEENVEDDGFDEFIDFDEEFDDGFPEEKEVVNHLNSSHNTVIDAESFMKKIEDSFGSNIRFTLTEIETVLKDIESLQFFDAESMLEIKSEILSILESIQDIINSVSDFGLEDMSNVVVELVDTFIKAGWEVDNLEKLNLASLYVKSILDDFKNWLNEIFIQKTANNINYANASFYNSVLTLKTLL